jgi:ATP/maltotriose-dependent transcriptional regulator MalT
MGEFNKSLNFSEEAYRLSKSINNIWGMSYSRYGVSIIYWERGEVDKTILSSKETIALGEEANFAVVQAMNRWFLAWTYGALGDFRKAFSIADEALSQPSPFTPLWQRYSPSLLAELYTLKGDLVKAKELTSQIEEIDEDMNPIFFYFILRSRCRIALAKGQHDGALKLAHEIITNAQTTGSLYYLEDHYFHGKVLLEMGHDDESYDALLSARGKAKEQDSKWSLWRILVAISRIEHLRGNIDEAERALTEARENITFISDHISDPELRAMFLEQPAVSMVFQPIKP